MTNIPDMPDDRAISLLAVDQYFRELHWTERLSEADEQKYLQRVVRASAEPSNQWLQRLAKDARDVLVASYQPLVLSMAKKRLQSFHHLDLLDLVQEGNIGLFAAFDDYVRVPHVAFFAIAVTCINRAFWNALYQRESQIHFPNKRTMACLAKIEKFQAKFHRVHGFLPDPSVIAEAVECSSEEVEHFLHVRSYDRLCSLEAWQTNEDGDNWEKEVVSLFFSQNQGKDLIPDGSVLPLLYRALEKGLTDIQRRVILSRYGLDDFSSGQSRPEIAACLGMTIDTVFDAERNAMNNLRSALQVRVEGSKAVYELSPLCSDAYCTVVEAMERLKRSELTVTKYIKKGFLPSIKVKRVKRGGALFQYLIPKEAVEAFAERQAIA